MEIQDNNVSQNQLDQTVNPALSPSQNFSGVQHKKVIIIIALVIILSLLGGGVYIRSQRIAQNTTIPPVVSPTSISPTPISQMLVSPSASISAFPIASISSELREKLTAAHQQFGLNLFQQLIKEEKNKNIFVSPISVSLALSMTYNGADGDTQKAMAKTLGFSDLSSQEINQANAYLLSQLKQPDGGVQLQIANAIYANQSYTILPQFLDENKKYYQAEVSNLNFSDPSSLTKVNFWVHDHTSGKITKILDKLSEDIIMVLLNAVYFKSTWSSEFDKNLTTDRSFTLASGSKFSTPVMKKEGDFYYFEDARVQGIALPYGKTGRVQMYIFLPKGPMGTVVANLSTYLHDRTLLFVQNEGTLFLPKFHMEYDKELKSTLATLGMGIAFERGKANFSKMINSPGVYLGVVIHKTYVETDEQGTEAAAVTAVLPKSGGGSGEIPKPFIMDINRPFLFVIADDRTNEILFMGDVQNPSLQ